MSEQELILGAIAGAVLLALCAMAWLVDQRRRNDGRLDELRAKIAAPAPGGCRRFSMPFRRGKSRRR